MRVLIALLAVAAGSCFGPNIGDGRIECAVLDDDCPPGFQCRACDQRCWRNPNLACENDGGTIDGADPDGQPDDTGVPDTMGPPDIMVPSGCGDGVCMPGEGENPCNCSAECGAPMCGDDCCQLSECGFCDVDCDSDPICPPPPTDGGIPGMDGGSCSCGCFPGGTCATGCSACCPPTVVCGNGICTPPETSATCPCDCTTTPPDGGGGCSCGCFAGGTCATGCSACCPPAIVCGNGICDPGESFSSCSCDCPFMMDGGGSCGCGCFPGGTCATGCSSCCPPAMVCGNGICDPGETSASCLCDCPVSPGGDGGASCSCGCFPGGTCATGCSACCPPAIVCGNGICNTPETAASCPCDCGPMGLDGGPSIGGDGGT